MKTLPSVLTFPLQPDVRLRLVDWSDAERMRVWKNAHKQFFFHQKEISAEDQRAWFASYLQRLDDHNYAAEERVGQDFEAVGLLGCRAIEGTVDIYNVMRGRHTAADLVNMGDALTRLCEEVQGHYQLPVTCKVLSNNPAIAWYVRNGFAKVSEASDHVVLRYFGRGKE
jgi:ribosomal protein S18 acetylase RimI-like enzyme